MGMIDLQKVKSEREKQQQENEDIIKKKYRESKDEDFDRFRLNSKQEFNGRAKFNGKLVAIIAAAVLLIFFIVYMCTTSISDVVEKKTGGSVISSDAKSFIISDSAY